MAPAVLVPHKGRGYSLLEARPYPLRGADDGSSECGISGVEIAKAADEERRKKARRRLTATWVAGSDASSKGAGAFSDHLGRWNRIVRRPVARSTDQHLRVLRASPATVGCGQGTLKFQEDRPYADVRSHVDLYAAASSQPPGGIGHIQPA